MGLVESAAEYYPDADWQGCIVHFYRNVFSLVPKGKRTEIARMLKAIHAQEDRKAALEKGRTGRRALESRDLKGREIRRRTRVLTLSLTINQTSKEYAQIKS